MIQKMINEAADTGELVNMALHSLRCTQAELARIMSAQGETVTPSMVSSWATARAVIPGNHLLHICKLCIVGKANAGIIRFARFAIRRKTRKSTAE